MAHFPNIPPDFVFPPDVAALLNEASNAQRAQNGEDASEYFRHLAYDILQYKHSGSTPIEAIRGQIQGYMKDSKLRSGVAGKQRLREKEAGRQSHMHRKDTEGEVNGTLDNAVKALEETRL